MNKFWGKVTIRLGLEGKFQRFSRSWTWYDSFYSECPKSSNRQWGASISFLGPLGFLYLLLSKFRLSPCLKQQLGWGWLACWGFCTPKQRGWASEGAWILTRSRSRLSCTFHMSPACDASEMISLPLEWFYFTQTQILKEYQLKHV